MYKDHVMLQLQHAPQHTHTQTLQTSSFIFLPECSGSAVAGSRPPLSLCCITGAQWNPPLSSQTPLLDPRLPLPEGPRQRFPCSREEKRDPGMGSLPASTRRGRSCPATASHPLTFIIKETPHPPPLSSPLTTLVERSYSASRRRSHC